MRFLEFIAVVSFSIAASISAIRKEMDLFGVMVMAVTVCTGGGLFRDLILNRVPPLMFVDYFYIIVGTITSILTFLFIRYYNSATLKPHYNKAIFVSDSIGLGLFTMFGLKTAIEYGYYDNFGFVIFIGVITGVGGGLLRDIFSNDLPMLFVKHIYAIAAMVGAIIAYFLWPYVDEVVASSIGALTIIIIRFFAYKYRWNFPKINIENLK